MNQTNSTLRTNEVPAVTDFRPNLFIVGAPKSGTTSLHNYLAQHPQILMSTVKEPCYLAPDFQCPNYPQSDAEYLSCFEKYAGEQYMGEATSTYLYSQKAAERIKEFSPDAKIIAMLRNPVQLVASLHAQRLKEGDENLASLEDALAAESSRRNNKKIPLGFIYPIQYLIYRDYGKYAEQLKRYFEVHGRDNVHVIIFDDFAADPKSTVQEVCRFLNVEPFETFDSATHNPAQQPKSIVVHRMASMMYRTVMRVGNKVKRFLPRFLVIGLWSAFSRTIHSIRKKNLAEGRKQLNPKTREQLGKFYQAEIEELEKLLGRDLHAWKEANLRKRFGENHTLS